MSFHSESSHEGEHARMDYETLRAKAAASGGRIEELLALRREGREPHEYAVEGADQIVEMLDNFSGAVLRGEPVRPDPGEAVKTLKVLDALARSARVGANHNAMAQRAQPCGLAELVAISPA